MVPDMDLSIKREASDKSTGISAPREVSDLIPDPLGDVIDWLSYANLNDDAALKEQAGKSSSPVGGDPGEPPVFTGRQKASSSGTQRGIAGYCGLEPAGRSISGLEPEEEEWDTRQQQTGAAGRLVVYEEGERPRSDVMLRGGNGRRVMVSAVTEGGKAAQAGVKAGDVLVSIDGKKDFKDKSADHVHAALKGPVMLVFLGFVGKLQAEVRLNYKQKLCGLSSQHQVVFGRPDAPVQVVDEVIFQPAMATLLLATSPPGPRSSGSGVRSMSRGKGGAGAAGDDGNVEEEPEDILDEGIKTYRRCVKSEAERHTVDSLAAVYELRGHEARSLVSRALSKARTSSPFAPRFISPSNVVGDNAQAPRAMSPTIASLSERLDGKFAGPPNLIPGMPFRFSADGQQAMLEVRLAMRRRASNTVASQGGAARPALGRARERRQPAADRVLGGRRA
eukprot:CAMPEP_0171159094 /NCGR_PEP_ID=MMETSP0790-20130122/2861_1 /TAXON_ID=2925 /ORGANISM="Alexandrium catenella, Strain OF101" /LENGTH=448 /DNA_ID=CAMNT_0011623579 /DNA_START=92 /DNA_END=1439 /DNA_ORIENTATION=-